MRILIADDNEFVRRGVAAILAADPVLIVCGEAIDGMDALEKARSLVPDLILLDISMPGMNGLEVARVLRKENPDLKMLIMSQEDPKLFLDRAKAAGANACVDKSRLSSDLLPAIAGLGKGNI